MSGDKDETVQNGIDQDQEDSELVTVTWPRNELDPMSNWYYIKEAIYAFKEEYPEAGNKVVELWEEQQAEIEVSRLSSISEKMRKFEKENKEIFVGDNGLKRYNERSDYYSVLSKIAKANKEPSFWDDYSKEGGYRLM